MARFIALEGLHGVGKSTVAEILAHRLGVEVTPTIPEEFSIARKLVNNSFCIEARYMLFLSATLSAGEQIEKILRNGIDVVAESYIFRSIAFHEGMGSRMEINVSIDRLFLPSHTILLTCNPAVRAERLIERGGMRTRWDALAEKNTHNIAARYAKFGFPEIDTSQLRPEMVVDKIMEMVYGNP